MRFSLSDLPSPLAGGRQAGGRQQALQGYKRPGRRPPVLTASSESITRCCEDMVMKWSALCLVAAAMLSHLCDAQYAKPGYNPPRFQKPAQTPQVQAAKTPQEPMVQSKQPVEAPLLWTFPVLPEEPPKPDVPFVLRTPVVTPMVAVECRERDARVEVKTALFGNRPLSNPSELTLGSCVALGEDSANQVLVFEADLHTCDSRVITTEHSLVYSFMLYYNPQPIGDSPVIRTTGAAILIECHYPRNINVSSNPLDPLWIPFAATKVSSELLYFSLVLKTDDWLYERPVFQFFLGDIINIEATVKQYLHVPLRVFVESCSATTQPDLSSNPRYDFIENNGCLVDGLLTGSASTFLPRVADNILQFQLEAFRFHGATSGLIYITCNLKATSASFGIDEQHRACSYGNGWNEASGVNGACGSCDAAGPPFGGGGGGGGGGVGGGFPANPGRKYRDVSQVQTEMVEWETVVHLGPIQISERVHQ